MLKLLMLLPCVLVVFVSCSAGSATQSAAQETRANEALYVSHEAKDVRIAKRGNSVAFRVDEPYPAERFRLQLDNHYLPGVWRKDDELRMFPGRRTSDNPGGWTRFLQGDRAVYMWMAN